MQRMFDKKPESNDQSILLITKPRIDFIDDEYKKITALITEVLAFAKELKNAPSTPEYILALQMAAGIFEHFIKKLEDYKALVLKSNDPYDPLSYRLIYFKSSLDNLKKMNARGFYAPCPSSEAFSLDNFIKIFENLDVILHEATVSKKEAVMLECNKQLNPQKKEKGCSIS